MIRNMILTAAGLAAFGLTKVVFNLAVKRVFPEGYLGSVNTAFSYACLVVALAGQVFATLSNRFVAEEAGAGRKEEAQRLFTGLMALLVVVTGAAIAVSAAALEPLRVQFTTTRTDLLVFLPYIALYGLYFFLKSSYYSFGNTRGYCMSEIVACTAFFGFLLAACLRQSEAMARWSFNVHGGVFCLIALFGLRRQIRFQGARTALVRRMRPMLFFGVHSWMSLLAGFGALHLSVLIISHYASDPGTVDNYSALLHSIQPVNLIPIALSTLLFPEMARNLGAKRHHESLKMVADALAVITLAMFPLLLLATALAPEATHILLGDSTRPVAMAFVILLASFVLRVHNVPLANYLTANHYVHAMAYLALGATVFGLIVWFTTVPIWGITGAASGNLAISVASVILVSALFYRVVGSGLRPHRLGAAGQVVLFAGAWGLGISWPGINLWFRVSGAVVLILLFAAVEWKKTRRVMDAVRRRF